MLVGIMLWAIALLIFSQGVLVVLRPGHLHRKLFFALATLFASSWTIALSLFLAGDTTDDLLASARIFYTSSAGLVWAILAFAAYTTDLKSRNLVTILSAIPFVAVVAWVIFAPETFMNNVIVGPPNLIELNSLNYSVYVAYFVLYALASIYVLFKGIAAALNTIEKKRTMYILTAYVVSLPFGTLFNLFLPWMGNYRLIWVGPIAVAMFAVIVYAAIVRYRLFNVKTVVTKILTWIIMLSMLSITCFLALGIIHSNQGQPYIFSVVDTAVFVVLFILFYGAMRYTIRFTERRFGSKLLDAKLLNQISAKALGHVNIKNMLNSVTETITEYVDDGYAMVYITDGNRHLQVGTRKHDLKSDTIKNMRKFFESNDKNAIATEEVNNSSELYEALRAEDISVVIKVSIASDEPSFGYLIIGTPRTNIYSDKEMNVLSAIGGVLSVSIENIHRYERIKGFNQELETKVEEATSDLRAVNRRLKRNDDSKDDFISMASHQLRTPLTSVRGYISMLLDGDFGHLTGEQKRVLDEAYSSSERMAFIISDFLDVSRLQTGKFELQKSGTNLSEVLASEISQLKLTAKTHDVKLSYSPSGEFPVVDLDHNKIRQVMMNMIDNAIFYSRNGGEVVVSLYAQAGKITFTVQDSGIGVPHGEQSKLFTKFYRASNARRVRPDGTGVGLYMARKIVVAHGGSVIFDSREDTGSIFGFRIPIR